jgi:hypothetical protein
MAMIALRERDRAAEERRKCWVMVRAIGYLLSFITTQAARLVKGKVVVYAN